MEEDADLSNIILHIFEKQKQNGSDVQYSDKFKCVNIGKTYLVNVIVNFPSCLNGNINKWKKRIENLYGHVNFHVAKNIPNIDENELSYNKSYFLCNVFKSTADTKTHLKLHEKKPYFVDDKTFIVPLEATVNNISSCDTKIYLTVSIVKPIPCPKRMLGESDFLLKVDDIKPLPEKEKIYTQKSVSRTLRIHQPPKLQVKYKDVSGQFMIFLSVNNDSLQDIAINDCMLMKGHCPACDKTINKHRDVQNDIGACKGCDHAIHMVSGDRFKFPVELGRGETLSLIFVLYKHNIETDYSELVLNAHVKWGKEILEPQAVTVYRLPKILFRKVPFVLDVQCGSKKIDVGESFKLTYTVTNTLQDFQEWRLYWNPVVPQISDQKKQQKYLKEIENIKSGLLCHDPVIKFGKLSYGSTVSTKVEFTILKPGLYEFGKHMKLNLTYNIPESPVKSPSQLVSSPEGLWRNRISSASSYGGDRELEEKRLSFGKSYSFGDLGPDHALETEPQENISLCSNDILQKSVVSSNFKKNSFLLYIPNG
ncbi:trafficking protein particle complex subunit 14-like isoform X1 [Mytilus edulis]|uniref:trafficking protein particle complex subunit 14-like isoform X1 n=2 Tax=Mytilus edulis TaxID=6550 RepID=UPI0039F14913